VDEQESDADFKSIRKKYEAGGRIQEDIKKLIEAELNSAPVVIFMKGTPAMPRCGFSKMACAILEEEGVVNYRGVDVLQDDALRQGIKDFSNWQWLPQIFINKEFIGGYDILKEMFSAGELKKKLQDAGVALHPKEGN